MIISGNNISVPIQNFSTEKPLSFENLAPDKNSVSVFNNAFSGNQINVIQNNSIYHTSLDIVTSTQVDFSQLSANILRGLKNVKSNMKDYIDEIVNEPIQDGDTYGFMKKQLSTEMLSVELETISKLMGKMVENINTLLRQ